MRTQERSVLTVSTPEGRALWVSTIAFTTCFAVWTIFAIIGIRIKDQLGLSEAEFGLLAGTPILTGSLSRIFLGIWTDRYGGRLIFTLTMLAASAATALLVFAETYPQMLLAALGVGLAGGSFAVGIAYVSRFFQKGQQGTVLGIFGAGNVGAAVTKFLAPFALVAWGWNAVALIWAGVLAITAVVFWFTTTEDPVTAERHRAERAPKAYAMEFAPLKDIRVWRFSLYYFFTFGAFVALALWLPRYLIGVYGFDIETAGMVAAAYSIPASVFRAYGGVLSDRVGARTVMYWCFAVSAIATLILSLPTTDYVMHGTNGPISAHFKISPIVFIGIMFVLGFFMSIGKAAVYKHVATYYSDNVGSVGGLVGMIGGLGGFILPIAFGFLTQATGLWTSCFMLLFLLVVALLIWMHVSVRRMESNESAAPAKSGIADEQLAHAGVRA